MVNFLKFLLTYKFKNSQPTRKNGGFTLIELLVGLVLAFLVIIPLLGFMVNLMQNDRQEQAKANTEQEIQSALDYIARDLEQAVYIYDGEGLTAIRNQLPRPDADSEPVLVFWKRQFLPNVLPNNNDAFVYALVAYYARKSNPATCGASPWSCTAQITRIQLEDGVDGSTPPRSPSPGFVLFDPGAGTTLEAAMNSWRSSGSFDFNQTPAQVLIDYIDHTALPTAQSLCPTAKQQVPPQIEVSGFYACVDVNNSGTANVFIRGNALARLRQKTNPPTYVGSRSSYFPQASIQVKGRGLFTINSN